MRQAENMAKSKYEAVDGLLYHGVAPHDPYDLALVLHDIER